MAHLEDPAAGETFVSNLDAPSNMERRNPVAVDALLAEVWPEMLPRSPRLLVCAHASPVAGEVSAFAQALGRLLDAHVSTFSPVVGNDPNCAGLARVVERSRYDLVIWGDPEQSFGQRLRSGPAYRKATKRVAASLLVVRRPRWPLKRLLLVVQGEEMDTGAVDWTVRLARPSGAAVTVLAVVPPVPAMYGRCKRMQQGLDALLTTNTALGRQMHRVARWLVEWEVEGTLRLRQGGPDRQIQREVSEGDYDLIVLAARPHKWWRRWLLGDRAVSLLHWADRPVLIAKPIIA